MSNFRATPQHICLFLTLVAFSLVLFVREIISFDLDLFVRLRVSVIRDSCTFHSTASRHRPGNVGVISIQGSSTFPPPAVAQVTSYRAVFASPPVMSSQYVETFLHSST